MSFKSTKHPGILHHYAPHPRLIAFEHTTSPFPSAPFLTQAPNSHQHTLLFLGGLGDGFLHPTYPSVLASCLPQNWRLVEVLLSSSYTGWTTSSLERDAEEVALAVRYFGGEFEMVDGGEGKGKMMVIGAEARFEERSEGEGGAGEEEGKGEGEAKIVLMGHSTGAQVCMEYVTRRSSIFYSQCTTTSINSRDTSIDKITSTTTIPTSSTTPTSRPPSPTLPHNRPQINGIILQAGISDREGLTLVLPISVIDEITAYALEWVESGRGGDILPNDISLMCSHASASSPNGNDPTAPASTTKLTDLFGAAPSAARWISLATRNGADDYFSSDLSDAELASGFGVLGAKNVPVLVLLSGEDEFMPKWVDKEGLVKRWERIVSAGHAVTSGEGGEMGGGRWDCGSGVVKGADHALCARDEGRLQEEVITDVVGRVNAFLTRIQNGQHESIGQGCNGRHK